ncbi:hypothetical protein PPL_08771 [Heterostelium album PN500]|uniref:Tyrosine-protein kinase ephrin type A/B receptor-like domain-containing protein n=1 Tax=Heterostelium pallidum (strain ATCC 26659 / Pp 5 / PN500) TaxID=670386 RepID=D3BJP3_HETP5|nr:hypothetical protein PPL_08771 [Heterostelium album PN500]EFA78123.1 hypothetical protein PPL_08771 [Heterostelium album PN500]|eukprot:XP_020430249.1 hypothetical protein PPL_08771 [Heterostelium album PN500]
MISGSTAQVLVNDKTKPCTIIPMITNTYRIINVIIYCIIIQYLICRVLLSNHSIVYAQCTGMFSIQYEIESLFNNSNCYVVSIDSAEKPIIDDWGFELIGAGGNASLLSRWVVNDTDQSPIKFCLDDQCGSPDYRLDGFYYAFFSMNESIASGASPPSTTSIQQNFTAPPIKNDEQLSYILYFFASSTSFITGSIKFQLEVYIDENTVAVLSNTIYQQQHKIDVTDYVNMPPLIHRLSFILTYSSSGSNNVENNQSSGDISDIGSNNRFSRNGILLSNIILRREPKVKQPLDLYVDVVRGSDRTGYGTKQLPFSSIAMALAWIQTTFTIYLADGNYCGYHAAGVVDSSISIIGQSADNTVINGQQSIQPLHFLTSEASELLLLNLTFINAYSSSMSDGGAVLNVNNANNATLHNFWSNINDSLVYLNEYSTVKFQRSIVYPAATQNTPIILFQAIGSWLVINNTLLSASRESLLYQIIDGDLLVVDSTMYNISTKIIYASGSNVVFHQVTTRNFTDLDVSDLFSFNMMNKRTRMVKFLDCTFHMVYGVFRFVNSNLYIANTTMQDMAFTGFYFDGYSEVLIQSSTFDRISTGKIFVFRSSGFIKIGESKFLNLISNSIISVRTKLFLVASNTLFLNNFGYTGGVVNVGGTDNRVEFYNCIFTNNSVNVNGGIVYSVGKVDITFNNCKFYNNSANQGGIAFFIKEPPIFNACEFSGNHANLGDIMASTPNQLILTNGSFPEVVLSNVTQFTGSIQIGDILNQISTYQHIKHTVYLQVGGTTIASSPFINGSAYFDSIDIIGVVGTNSTVVFTSSSNLILPMKLPYNVSVLPCNSGYYPIDSSTQCSICPSGSYGYDGNKCISCPQNALCQGGDQVSTRPGYWFDENQFPRVIYDCDQSSHCLENNTCLEHTFGVLCSSCNNTEQYYSWFGSCIECTQTNKLVIAIVIIGMILLVLWSHKSDSSSGLMNIVVYFAQTIMVLSKGVNFSILSLLNLQLESGGSSIIGSICPGPFDYYQRHYTTFLVFPAIIFILLIFTIIITIIRKFKPNDQPIFPRQFGSFVKLLMNIYSPISTATFTIFFCQQIGIGNSVLVTDSSVQCSGNQYRTALKVSYSMLVVVLGIPMIIFILLFKNRKHNNDASIIRTYGAFILKYKTSYYYWDVILLFRRLVIVLVSIMDQDTPIRSFLLIGVSLISVLLQLKHSPFISEGDNQLELVSLILIFISCIYLGNEIESYLEDWIIIVCCISFAIYLLYIIYTHYRISILKRINHYLSILSRGRFGYEQLHNEMEEDPQDDHNQFEIPILKNKVNENEEID